MAWRSAWVVFSLAGCAAEAPPTLEAGEYQLDVSMSGCFGCARMPSFAMEPDGSFHGNRLDSDACCEGTLSREELVRLTERLDDADALHRGDGMRCIDCGTYRFDVVVPAPDGETETLTNSFRVASTAVDAELRAVLDAIDSALRQSEAASACETCPPPTGL